MKLNKVHVAVVAALTGASGLLAQSAFAQQGGGLEEIVVTATRRSENLQEVPVSIVAITGEGLEVRGLQNVENLNATVPNLSVMGSSGGSGTSATSFRASATMVAGDRACSGPRTCGTTQNAQNLSQPVCVRTNAWNGVGRICESRSGS